MSLWLASNTAATTSVITFTSSTSSTSNVVITFATGHPAPAPRKGAQPPKFRKGDPVRIIASGILRGRVGLVQGLLAVGDQWTVFVEWPDGGLSTMGEGSLEALPENE